MTINNDVFKKLMLGLMDNLDIPLIIILLIILIIVVLFGYL